MINIYHTYKVSTRIYYDNSTRINEKLPELTLDEIAEHVCQVIKHKNYESATVCDPSGKELMYIEYTE